MPFDVFAARSALSRLRRAVGALCRGQAFHLDQLSTCAGQGDGFVFAARSVRSLVGRRSTLTSCPHAPGKVMASSSPRARKGYSFNQEAFEAVGPTVRCIPDALSRSKTSRLVDLGMVPSSFIGRRPCVCGRFVLPSRSFSSS